MCLSERFSSRLLLVCWLEEGRRMSPKDDEHYHISEDKPENIQVEVSPPADSILHTDDTMSGAGSALDQGDDMGTRGDEDQAAGPE